MCRNICIFLIIKTSLLLVLDFLLPQHKLCFKPLKELVSSGLEKTNNRFTRLVFVYFGGKIKSKSKVMMHPWCYL